MGRKFPKVPSAVKAEVGGNLFSFAIVGIVGVCGVTPQISTILIVAGDTLPLWILMIYFERRISRGLF